MRSIGEPRQGKVLPTMRLAFLALLCCVGLLTIPADGFASGLVESIKRIKPSIVAIGTYDQLRRPPGKFRGTGFAVVDGQHVLTNQHVLPSKTDLAIVTGHRCDMSQGARSAINGSRRSCITMRSSKQIEVTRI